MAYNISTPTPAKHPNWLRLYSSRFGVAKYVSTISLNLLVSFMKAFWKHSSYHKCNIYICDSCNVWKANYRPTPLILPQGKPQRVKTLYTMAQGVISRYIYFWYILPLLGKQTGHSQSWKQLKFNQKPHSSQCGF